LWRNFDRLWGCGRFARTDDPAFDLLNDHGLRAAMRKALANDALLNRTLQAQRFRLSHMQGLVTRCVLIGHSLSSCGTPPVFNIKTGKPSHLIRFDLTERPVRS